MANEESILNWTSLQETMSTTKKRAMRSLLAEYTSLLKEPSEGFVVKVNDPFSWEVGIYGPPATLYWGGYFKLLFTFPDDYPFEPPKLKFKSRFWHPNVYHNGAVCMSILHDPQEDIPSDLAKEEKWNPTLSVRTVLLSLISILGAPNPDSPANPEAAKMYRSWLEKSDQDYVKVIEDIVKRSKKVASRDGVTIPKTLDEYLIKSKPKLSAESLVNYSSDSDGPSTSNSSDPLSMTSSDDSEPDELHESVSSWIPSSENCTTSTPLSEGPSVQGDSNLVTSRNTDLSSGSAPDHQQPNDHNNRITGSNIDQFSLPIDTTLRIHEPTSWIEPTSRPNNGAGDSADISTAIPVHYESNHDGTYIRCDVASNHDSTYIRCAVGSNNDSTSYIRCNEASNHDSTSFIRCAVASNNDSTSCIRCDVALIQQTPSRKRRRPSHLQRDPNLTLTTDLKKRKKE